MNDGLVRIVTDMRSGTDAIATASHEIEQVDAAVGQMDRVTQQNAALVEEAAAASKTMDDQAGKLRTAASVFKLPGAALSSR